MTYDHWKTTEPDWWDEWDEPDYDGIEREIELLSYEEMMIDIEQPEDWLCV